MTRPETQKHLGGDIPVKLHDDLMEWINDHKNTKIRQVVQALAELWLLLPERLQGLLLITKCDAEGFIWVADEIGQNLLTLEEAFDRKAREARNGVRRLLLLLQDYSITREAINSDRDLDIALRTTHELFLWVAPQALEAASDRDRYVIQRLVDILNWRNGRACETVLEDPVSRWLLEEVLTRGSPGFKKQIPDLVRAALAAEADEAAAAQPGLVEKDTQRHKRRSGQRSEPPPGT